MPDDHPPRGYIKDASYPTTYFRELSPVWLNYVAALGGAVPRKLDQNFSYLELGSGTAFSSVIHAACFPAGEFHACDFNPENIATGERYAHELSIRNVLFHPVSFLELLERDLRDFDFIVLHGVYSWVGAQARQTILQLIRKLLKPGGLVYVSYNCMPGWTLEVPLRRLLIEFATASDGDSPQRVASAVRWLQRLSSAGLRYFRTNPAAVTAVDAYARSPSDYLAHEFLNETWEPLYSIDVADQMMSAGLTYLGSATLVDNHDALVIDSSAGEAIAEMPTTRLQQLATDFAVDRQFRRDVFVRSESRIDNVDDITGHLGQLVVGCMGNPEAINTAVQVPRGNIGFQADFISELRTLMSHGSTTLYELVTSLGGESRHSGEIIRNLCYLIAAGELRPFAQPFRPTDSDNRPEFASETIKRMFVQVAGAGVAGQIASEVVGGGVALSPRDALAVIDYIAADDPAKMERGLADQILRLNRFGVLV
ncbi:MAG: class I SAM-dependent methyltransferase [Gammaproteobacteria bacterium]|nr:class I SAM-dependent methyltransferase [Gammaproteobacteria bacterium]